MKQKRQTTQIPSAVFSAFVLMALPCYALADDSDLLRQLGWVSAPKKNLCQGYFKSSSLKYSGKGYKINADNWTHDLNKRITTFKGDVVLKQEGSLVNANQAIVKFDEEDEVTDIELVGNVQLIEADRTLAGSKITIDYQGGPDQAYEASYLFREPQPAFGTASYIQREDNGNLQLKQATYSTCAPDKVTWRVVAKELNVDKQEGVAKAYHTKIYFKDVPVFYSPYLSFAIDDRRKSGFLAPTLSYSEDNGFDGTFPYYFNLAPNYDFTFYPRVMTNRGVQAGGEFRFLTKNTYSEIYGTFLPNDNEFNRFRQNAAAEFGVTPRTQPYLDSLASDSNDRGYVTFASKIKLNKHLTARADINYVTDDYYFQDFGAHNQQVYLDQLLNQFLINYEGTHWQLAALVQGYQTLHIIDTQPILDQYQRLPQINVHGFYPRRLLGLDYEVDSEFVYFTQGTTFTGATVPDGKRFHLRPSISRPFTTSYAFFNPRVQLDVTSYSLDDVRLGNPTSITRVLPMVDVNSGLIFDRTTTIASKEYLHTLEPTVQYLYIPYENQDDIPRFDTFLPNFTSERFFSLNRFTGFDRIGDNNRLSLALTSRLFDLSSGNEVMSLTVGQAYYFDTRRVCLTISCSQDTLIDEDISPVIAQLKLNLIRNIAIRANYSYDPTESEMQSVGATVRYSNGINNLFSIGYTFEKEGDIINRRDRSSSENNLNRIRFAMAKPITQNIHILGHINYNVSHEHPQSYSAGVEYQGCCVAIRGIFSKTLLNESLDNGTEYDTAYYLQFQLKGLGTMGANNPSTLLKKSIPGYVDQMRRE